MSEAPRADAQRPDDSRPRRPPPKAWPRAIALPIAAVWLVVSIVLGVMASRDDIPEISGDLDGLIPVAHRLPPGEPLLLLQTDDTKFAGEGSPEEAVLSAGKRIADRMKSERVPIAPPAAELTAWQDAHALYLLPVQTHDALQTALSEDAMRDSVDGLKARLSSPMFGVTGEQPRRDPLGLSQLDTASGTALSDLDDPGSRQARPTAAGDLIAHDGRALLIQLQTDRAMEAVARDVDDAVADLPVTGTLVGPVADRARATATIQAHAGRLAIVTLAGLTLVLAIALRSVRAVVAIVACISSVIAALLIWGPPVDLLRVPLLVLLAGFGCEGALHLQRISERGWPAAAVLGTALLPLLLSPYPSWSTAAIHWAVGLIAVVVVLRLVLPALRQLIGGARAWTRRGFLLRPMRGLAVVLSFAALAGGGWAVERLHFRGFDQPLLDTDDAAVRVLSERFFDPGRIAHAHTAGHDPVDAVTRSANDARALNQLVPEHANRIDSPGAFVLPMGELSSRRDALQRLQLDERMDILFEVLTTQGFHADAFGEFLRGASDLEDLPTPEAALDGPLGPWIASYLTEVDDVVVLRSIVHLRAGDDAVPSVERDQGPPIELSGPAIGARMDRDVFADWLGIYVALQLWLGAVVVWLGTRSLATSLGATVAALTAETAVLAAMVGLHLPLGPEMVPALLLVGAAGMVAGGRACRAIALRRPFFATGLLVTGLCQVAAGTALISTGEPAWVRVGWLIAVGTLAASGAGLFVAPGIAKLFRAEFGDGPPSKPDADASVQADADAQHDAATTPDDAGEDKR